MGISGRQWLRGWVRQEDLARAVDDKWMGNARNGVIHGSYHADSRERTGHDEDDPFHFALCSSFSLNTNDSGRRPVACPRALRLRASGTIAGRNEMTMRVTSCSHRHLI